ncbi:dioxygenase [Betaproteobacteria bacterium SCN2]|jgi:4,5-DOPA dioxygenase extradiol|nr:dioxygenase [Betaproteobacteria bacterium SCN2]
MAARTPVVFVSHGAPDVLLKAPDTVACWREIGRQLPEPSAILAVSAHWQARSPTLSLAGAPVTIHDFSGFAPALRRMQYPAPGAPALAERAASLIRGAGVAAELHPDRGLDHGAWVPLSALYPQANVPVAQLSLMRQGGPGAHLALGRALAPLREEGVLILASGAVTHNFGWLDRENNTVPLPQARAFSDWVGERLAAGDAAALLDYRSVRYGAEAHPTDEHFLPLFVALGAAAGEPPARCQPGFTYGGLSMDAYAWH